MNCGVGAVGLESRLAGLGTTAFSGTGVYSDCERQIKSNEVISRTAHQDPGELAGLAV